MKAADLTVGLEVAVIDGTSRYDRKPEVLEATLDKLDGGA